ncbi:uncharacterized protein LOC108217962 [Daucus carota subsp. sativus]|nr:PREDICTED: uncharacterized protein LOC108217962 [Daucus carota subsp. sativus]
MSNKMENMDCLWTYQESNDDLKQQLLYKSIELESVKAEAEKQMKIHKAYEKQTLQSLNMVIQERDEARAQLCWLLNKLIASNYMTPSTEFFTIAPPQLPPECPFANPMRPILSTTESNSFSGLYSYHSQDSSPVSSVFEPVSSSELSGTYAGALSNKMAFVNQHIVQDYNGISPTSVPHSGASKIDQYIDHLVSGKTLPQKGKLSQSVLDAGPLLETLLVAGPVPKWRNPPPLDTLNIPPFTGKGGHVKNFNQKPTELLHASPQNTRSYVEMHSGSQITSNAVLQSQDVASGSCFGIGKDMSSAQGNDSLTAGKRQRFL